MAIVKDPEGIETSTLHALVDFKDLSVLEVGCGEGRFTWRYADSAAQVIAIDPKVEGVQTAQADTPNALKERVRFMESTIDDFAASRDDHAFDIAMFAWSL